MSRLRLLVAATAFLLGLGTGPAYAASSINTAQPVQGAPYNASPIRLNFGAAANDINALQTLNAGVSAPSNPSLGYLWLSTPSSGTVDPLNVWDGTSWVPIAALDTGNHLWTPPIGGGVPPTIVSATTTDLGSVPQATVSIAGTVAVQNYGSSAPTGSLKVVLFTAATPLVNSASLILPGNTNITQAAGGVEVALARGAGVWQVVFDSQSVLAGTGINGTFICPTISTTNGVITAATGLSGCPVNVPTNAALMALVVTVPGTTVYRAGFYAAGDGGGAYYNLSGSPCSLNSGNGDNGSQVKASNGNCWLAQFSGPADVREWGVQLGVASQDAALQNAINASVTLGICLYKPLGEILLATGVSTTAPNLCLEGNDPEGEALSSPTSSIRATTNNIVLLDVTGGVGAKVSGILFDAAPGITGATGILYDAGTNSAEASHDQFNGLCPGLDITGEPGSQNNSSRAIDNIFLPQNSASCDAFRIGHNSTLGGTVDLVVRDNIIHCNNSSVGYHIYDAGGINISGIPPYACSHGTMMTPGVVPLQQELWNTLVSASGGDTSNGSGGDIYSDTLSPTAVVTGNQLFGSWASNSTVGPSVVLHNTAAGYVSGWTINGARIYMSANQSGINIGDANTDAITASISGTTLNVTADANNALAVGRVIYGSGVTVSTTITSLGSGSGGVGTYNVNASQTVGSEAMTSGASLIRDTVIENSTICSPGASTGAGISELSGAYNTSITGNRVKACDHPVGGSLAVGINIGTDQSLIGSVMENDLTLSTTPISWNYTGTPPTLQIWHNLGLDNIFGVAASGGAVAIPVNPLIEITGSTATTDFTTTPWSSRSILVYTPSGVAFNTGGGTYTKFCNSLTTTAGNAVTATYIGGLNCWLLH